MTLPNMGPRPKQKLYQKESRSPLRKNLFPYCMEMKTDGRWVFYNRAYTPVGFFTGDVIHYQDYPVAVTLKGLGPKVRAFLCVHGDGSGDRIYLYNDSCLPEMSKAAMSKYMEKLARLMRLTTGVRT